MSESNAPRRYLWDFFGPASEQTARHFLKHLGEFLQAEALTDLPTGTESAGENHRAVFCIASADNAQTIEQKLKPNRMLAAE